MITIALDPTHRLPTIAMAKNLSIMLGTGINIPIFTRGMKAFKDHFPEATKLTEYSADITDYSGTISDCGVYTINELSITSTWKLHYVPVTVLKSAQLPTMIIPRNCHCRRTCGFTYGANPYFETDYNDLVIV